MTKRVRFCVPFVGKPYPQVLKALGDSACLLRDAGWDINTEFQHNHPYISSARNTMLRAALDAKADVIVFIDHDLSWTPRNLLTLIETPGDVVCGTYRFKRDDVEYMGHLLPDINGDPQPREVGTVSDPFDPLFDGACLAFDAPAGFLKITPECVDRFIRAYPDLAYGPRYSPSVDLFNHGAHKGVWYGEDYAFCRNWRDLGGEILLLPNLDISHWRREDDGAYTEYPGNYHWYQAHRAGGALNQGVDDHAEHETDRSGIRGSAA